MDRDVLRPRRCHSGRHMLLIHLGRRSARQWCLQFHRVGTHHHISSELFPFPCASSSPSNVSWPRALPAAPCFDFDSFVSCFPYSQLLGLSPSPWHCQSHRLIFSTSTRTSRASLRRFYALSVRPCFLRSRDIPFAMERIPEAVVGLFFFATLGTPRHLRWCREPRAALIHS